MSTIKTRKTQRARKIVLLMLGVTSIASIGIVVAHADFNNLNQENNLINNPANSDMNNLMFIKVKSNGYKANVTSVLNKNKDIISLVELLGLSDLYQYKKVTVTATGYTAGIESTGKDISHPEYGITYSGVQVRRDVYSTIAADLKVFPLGTVLYIPNYGYGVVADIGSAIKGNKIDLYFDTVDDVYSQWGKRKVDVYVLKYGDGFITDNILEQYNQVAMANLSS